MEIKNEDLKELNEILEIEDDNEEEYEKWVNIFNAPVGYEDYYEWDTGIAP